jgi:hypothetical protein
LWIRKKNIPTFHVYEFSVEIRTRAIEFWESFPTNGNNGFSWNSIIDLKKLPEFDLHLVDHCKLN